MKRRTVVLITLAVVIVSGLACTQWLRAYGGPGTASVDVSRIEPPNVLPYVVESTRWLPVPEFRVWLAAWHPSPDPSRNWLPTITGAIRAGNTLIVETSLATDRTSIEPAMSVCAVAIEFMFANSQHGLRVAGVTGADQSELVRGSLDQACKNRTAL